MQKLLRLLFKRYGGRERGYLKRKRRKNRNKTD
jgi:hypothetical protein